jgi:hypothetical protein
MTLKEKMLKKSKRLKVAGYLFLFASVAVIGFVLVTGIQLYSLTLPAIASIFLGLGLLIQAGSIKRNWWNNLSLDGRCEEMALDLKSGKREWYLNSFSNTNYYFAPLSKKNMSEFGGGEHLSANKDEILRLIKEGKIENSEMAKLTISHFENL